jgi:adenine/guanine phosphoribosyltransferase-like PRPP-binding protein
MAEYRTSYLSNVFDSDRFRNQLLMAERRIREFAEEIEFDAIAFTGTSGSAFAYPLSFLLGMPLICVRKFEENNHYYGKVEGFLNAKNYIIVDDFISGGDTIRTIMKEIETFYVEYERPFTANLVGVYMYGTKDDVDRESDWKSFCRSQQERLNKVWNYKKEIPIIG